MADVQVLRKLMNPWALHLQKMGLELKCPLCLNLLDKPMLLPCNHLFCSICIPGASQCGSECAVCNIHYDSGDMRPAPYMDNIVSIYKMLDATFAITVCQPLSSEQSPVSALRTGLHGSTKDLTESPNEKMVSGGKESVVEARAWLNSCDKDIVGLSDKADKGASSNCNEVTPCVGSEAEDMYMNQAPVLSPESSPSFNQIRNTAINNPSQGSRNTLVKSTAKRSVDCLSDAGKDALSPVCKKRQNSSNYSPSYSGVFTNGHVQERASCSTSAVISQCTSKPAHEDHLPISQSAKVSDSSNSAGRVCSFCHSSKISEGSGTMVYYADGKEVKGDLTMQSNVIPVHCKCIEWTPQVYFEGDTIKNLESELKRASKLKCCSCGLKGAALGCFDKSCRRSYHVPCAFDIQECRWDCVDFLVLCPQHNAVKFPREKSNSKSRKYAIGPKHPLKTDSPPVNPIESAFWASSPSGRQEWVLCASALSSEEKQYQLAKFAEMCGATLSKFWKPTVTHIIAETDEKGACTRTLKVLMGMLNGRWILSMGWIKACMEANHYVNEEPYEINIDNHGCLEGPKTGRLRFLHNEPKLFEGLKFYFNGDFPPAYMVNLLDLVKTGGGIVIENLEQSMQNSDTQTLTRFLVVYYYESSPCHVGELKRLAEAEAVAKRLNSPIVRHTWILECISASKLIPYT